MILEGLAVVIVAVTAIVIYTITSYYTSDKRLPPGPIPLPLVGNMFNMGPQPHLSLTSLSKTYGDIFRLSVGIHRIVVVNSIEAAREALVRRSSDFAGRPLLYTGSLITRKGKSISFGDFNATWKRQRKIAHSALKMFGSGIGRLEKEVSIITLPFSEVCLSSLYMKLQLTPPQNVVVQYQLSSYNAVLSSAFNVVR